MAETPKMSEGASHSPKQTPSSNENFSISRNDKGRYDIRIHGVALSYSVETEKIAQNIVGMALNVLAQHRLCKAKHQVTRGVRKRLEDVLADCTVSTREKPLSGMNIIVDNTIIGGTSIVDEEQFRKAFDRVVKSHDKEKVENGIGDSQYYFGDEFARFVSEVASKTDVQSQEHQFAEK